MKAKVFGIVFMVLTLINYSCQNKSTEPKPDDPDKPGRRDYVWTVDTLSYPPEMFTLQDIWGANPNDIWAIGTAPSTNHSLWHYDGKKWTVQSGILLSSNLQGIYGFATDDIWLINSTGAEIYHYNGISWTEVGNYFYPGYNETVFNGIWGPSSNEIYVVGSARNEPDTYKSFILKYNGNTWQYLDIPELDVNFTEIRKNKENNLLYLDGINFFSTGYIFYAFVYDGNIFTQKFSGKKPIFLDNIRKEVFISNSSERKVYRYENAELVEWKNYSGTQYRSRIFGRSEIDFFALGENNSLLHYNGTNMEQIYQFDGSFHGFVIFEKDIFLLSKGQYNYVIHGKLID